MMLMIMTINFCFQGVLSLGSLGRPSFGSRIQEREEETCICAPVVIGKSLLVQYTAVVLASKPPGPRPYKNLGNHKMENKKEKDIYLYLLLLASLVSKS